MREGIYVASRTHHAPMWRRMREGGAYIRSTWIDEAGVGETADWSELWRRIVDEVAASELLICYVEPADFPLKGTFIEAGAALMAKIPVRVVLPGVHIDPNTYRPIGSWITHPLVSQWSSVVEAIAGERL